MKKFNDRQIEAMRIVKSDLDFIKKNWGQDIDDDSLRRNSSTIRQMLLDEGGLLLKVANLFDQKIYVQAPPNPLLFENIENITFYLSGGAKYKGATVQTIMTKNYAMSSEEIKKNYEQQKDNRLVKMDLDQFLSVPVLIINGESFSRTEIIKYIANKSGGAHYELSEKKLARMKNLENAKNEYSIMDKNAPYFEFLSIGQMLVKTKYIDKLKKKISKVI